VCLNNRTKVIRSTLHVLTLGFLVSAVTSTCSDSFMKEKLKDSTTSAAELATTMDASGNVSATIDPNATSTQMMRASSGAVAGSAIAMPAGALSVPVTITIGQGETLASSDVSQQIGLSSNTATAAGPAVSFMPSSNVEASSAFTLSIPISSSTSLELQDAPSLTRDLTVVMYKWMKVDGTTVSYEMGLLPPAEITIGSKSVSFQTKKFGTFQIATLQQPVTERIKQPTIDPPMMKADSSNPLVGSWSVCESSSSQSNNDRKDTCSITALATPVSSSGESCEFLTTYENDTSKSYFTFQLGGTSIPSGTRDLKLLRYSGSNQWQASTKTVSGSDTNITFEMVKSNSNLNNSDALVMIAPDDCYFALSDGSSKTRTLNYNITDKDSPIYGLSSISGNTITLNKTPTAYSSMPNFRIGDLIRLCTSTNNYRINALVAYNSFSVLYDDTTSFNSSIATPCTGQLNPTTTFVKLQPYKNGSSSNQFNFETISGRPDIASGFFTNEVLSLSWQSSSLKVKVTSADSTGISFSSMESGGPIPANQSFSLINQTCRESNQKAFTLTCGNGTVALPTGLSRYLRSGNQTENSDTYRLGIEKTQTFSRRSTVKFTGTTFIHTSSTFSGSNCDGTLISKTEETGTYKLGTKTGDATFPITITKQNARAGVFDQAAATIANNAKTCGNTDWAVNTAKDLSKTALCAASKDEEMPEQVRIVGGKTLNFKDHDTCSFNEQNWTRQ
jgi:hypothetical protein